MYPLGLHTHKTYALHVKSMPYLVQCYEATNFSASGRRPNKVVAATQAFAPYYIKSIQSINAFLDEMNTSMVKALRGQHLVCGYLRNNSLSMLYSINYANSLK